MIENSGFLLFFILLMGVAGLIAVFAAMPERRTLMTAPPLNRRGRGFGRRMYWSLRRRLR